MTNREIIRQAVDLLSGLKGQEKLRVEEYMDSLKSIRFLTRNHIASLIGRRPSPALNTSNLIDRAMDMLRECERNHIGRVTLGEDDYPLALAESSDPPYCLYYRGQRPRYDWEGIAVVGTRIPTGNARNEAFRLGLELAQSECPLISGLALGIDGEAHRGALAGRGVNIAVLGSGVDLITPRRNEALGREILETGGTILSEYTPGTPAAPWRFPARNRIIAGLARSVAVVQAPRKSGALITADFALDEGREVVITPAGLRTSGSAGLLNDGAILVESARELLAGLEIDVSDWESPLLPGPESRKDLVEYMRAELKEEIIYHGGNCYRIL